MRPIPLATVTLLILAASRAGSQSAPEAPLPSVELPPSLERVLRDYERAWRARDAKALAELFTEDGFVLSNGSPPMRGRPAIRSAYAHGGGPLELQALAYATQDSLAYIIGVYGPGLGRGATGKFILALRRGGEGRWLIAADMDNSNQRPGPLPAPPTR